MGKKKRIKMMRKQKEMADILNQVFLGDDSLPLTDDLIEELVKRGMPEKDLLYCKQQGGRYSVPRGSIVFPPEIDFDF